jgi:hypothetical protein
MLIITGIISINAFSFSQYVHKNRAFGIGEELKYYAYYNWGKIWIKAGKAVFSVGKNNDNYLFTVTAQNLPGWDWLYHLETTHKAEMTKQMKPVSMKATTIENEDWDYVEFIYDGDYIYKHLVNKQYPEGKDTVYRHTPHSWDIINAVYVARNTDFEHIRMGELIPYYLNFNDSTHIIYGKVLKKERIKNREGEEFDCLKCSATVSPGTIFAAGEPVYVWITDDMRRIPVLIESRISIGSIKVFLYEYRTGVIEH